MPRLAAAAVLFIAALAAPGPAALGEGEAAGKPAKGGVFPEVAEVGNPEEAKALLGALSKAVEGKEEERILAALAPMVTKRHKDFVPELKKLVVDKRPPVAAAAAKALGSQGDKGAATLLAKAVAAEVRERGFLRDADLKAEAVEALGRLGVTGSFDAIDRLAQAMLREPEVRTQYARRIVRACVRYFGLTKEKRAVSYLIDEVEQPEYRGGSPNQMPPPEHWKARYDIWVEVRADAVWALKEITGKEFETYRRWQKWFENEGKKEGMK